MHRTQVLAPIAVVALILAPPVAARANPSVDTVHCGATVKTALTLTHDLTGCPGDGLVVGSAGVRINLNGHHISGTGAAGSAGVRDIGFDLLTVFGGVVQAFDTGIDVEHADRLRVMSVSVLDSPSFGLLLAHTAGGAVLMSQVEHAGASGIQLVSATHYLLVGNTLSHNGDGVALYESSYNIVASSTSSDNGAGIDLVHGSDHNLIAHNTTDREDDTGVLLDDHADSNLIAANHATGDAFSGIAVGASDGNVVSSNQVEGNLGSGVAVVDDATRTLVINNTADRNGTSPPGCVPDCPLLDDGIHIDAVGTTLTANHAGANADLGIDAPSGVTDGGRNVAHRNGDARQCTGVSCG